MDYQMFGGEPLAFFISLLISLVTTLIAYGAFPLIFAYVRKSAITAKRYRRTCFGVNILVMFLFIAINGSSNGAPYFLWTTAFSAWGKYILSENDLLIEEEEEDSEAETPVVIESGGQTVAIVSYVTPTLTPVNLDKPIEAEKTVLTPEDIDEPANEVALAPSSEQIAEPIKMVAPVPVQVVGAIPNASVQDSNDKPVISFCRHCGKKLEEGSVYCNRCGKKVAWDE